MQKEKHFCKNSGSEFHSLFPKLPFTYCYSDFVSIPLENHYIMQLYNEKEE